MITLMVNSQPIYILNRQTNINIFQVLLVTQNTPKRQSPTAFYCDYSNHWYKHKFISTEINKISQIPRHKALQDTKTAEYHS